MPRCEMRRCVSFKTDSIDRDKADGTQQSRSTITWLEKSRTSLERQKRQERSIERSAILRAHRNEECKFACKLTMIGACRVCHLMPRSSIIQHVYDRCERQWGETWDRCLSLSLSLSLSVSAAVSLHPARITIRKHTHGETRGVKMRRRRGSVHTCVCFLHFSTHKHRYVRAAWCISRKKIFLERLSERYPRDHRYRRGWRSLPRIVPARTRDRESEGERENRRTDFQPGGRRLSPRPAGRWAVAPPPVPRSATRCRRSPLTTAHRRSPPLTAHRILHSRFLRLTCLCAFFPPFPPPPPPLPPSPAPPSSSCFFAPFVVRTLVSERQSRLYRRTNWIIARTTAYRSTIERRSRGTLGWTFLDPFLDLVRNRYLALLSLREIEKRWIENLMDRAWIDESFAESLNRWITTTIFTRY